MTRPKIFVASASSVEGLAVASLVKARLREWADCSLWQDEDVFKASTVVIESLERALDLFPYGVFVMSPDDSTVIRDRRHLTPRDNLVFELGLFAGRHGRRSVFILIPRDFELHLPSDLAGVVTCQYERSYGPGEPTFDAMAACAEIRRRIEEVEQDRPVAASSRFWDVLSDVVVIVFGLEHSPDDPPGTHPRISLRDLEAAQAVAGFLGRRYPRKRVLTIPASAVGWQRHLPPQADLVVIGGGVSNVEFARHRDLYQRHFRLKMGRLCRIEGQRVYHVGFARLPPGLAPPPRGAPEAIDRFPSEHVSRDVALVFSKRVEIYGARRRVVGIAGVKGNGTRGAALYLTQGAEEGRGLDAVLGRPLGPADDLELVVATEVVHDLIDRTELVEAVLGGERLAVPAGGPASPCELSRPCAGCAYGEELAGEPVPGSRPGWRAIIFDLDDTLVDTSGMLIVPLEIEAAASMVEAGAPIRDAAKLAALLLRLRRDRPDRLEEELERALPELPPAALAARQAVFASVPAERLELDPAVRLLLRDLAHSHDLFLLTEGDPDLQNRKIDHLKLSPLFREIVVVPSGEEPDKEDAIAALLARRGLEPGQAMIVGNRLDREILAGARLGLSTVWVRHGEGAGLPPETTARPDHVIESLLELRGVLAGGEGS